MFSLAGKTINSVNALLAIDKQNLYDKRSKKWIGKKYNDKKKNYRLK